MNEYTQLKEKILQFPPKDAKKLNLELPYDPTIPLPGLHQKELKAGT